jgi:hypothetical protein
MVERFRQQADEEYQEFLGKCRDLHAELEKERKEKHFTFAELEENEVELTKLDNWLVKARSRDFFGGKLAKQAAAALEEGRRDFRRFSVEVAGAEGAMGGNRTPSPKRAAKSAKRAGRP